MPSSLADRKEKGEIPGSFTTSSHSDHKGMLESVLSDDDDTKYSFLLHKSGAKPALRIFFFPSPGAACLC